MKLLREVNQEVKIISEAVEGAKKYFIEGIFIQCEKANRNGRKYKKEWMTEEVSRYCEEYVSKNRAFGELGHPENPTINLERVSHLIVGTHGTARCGTKRLRAPDSVRDASPIVHWLSPALLSEQHRTSRAGHDFSGRDE